MKKETNVPKTIIVYELLLGLFEFISGFGILFFGKSLFGIYEQMKNAELLEDSNDLFVKIFEKFIPNIFQHRYYLAFFLLSMGAVKIASGIGLIYKKEWAEHLLIIFLTVLIPFDLVGEAIHFSLFKTIYLAINIFIVLYLINFKPIEYQQKLKNYLEK